MRNNVYEKIEFVSFVIPYYNSIRSVSSLYNEIKFTLNKTNIRYEIIIIDDASDKLLTIEETEALNKMELLKYIRLPKNQGQNYATTIGVSKAKGNIIFTLDDDLYINTEFICLGLNRFISENLDILYCIREVNRQQPFYRVFISNIIKKILCVFFNIQISSIRVFNTKIKNEIISHIENSKLSIDKIIYFNTYKIGTMNVKIESFGKTRYNIFKLTYILIQFVCFK